MNRKLVVVIGLTSILACTPVENNNEKYPTINLEGLWESNDYLHLSDVAESIEYIKLEKTPACILPEAGIVTGNMWGEKLVLQSHMHNANQIYLFNRVGEFETKIGNYGEGPGEYLSPYVQLDTLNEIIYVLDRARSRLISYDYTGKLLKDFSVPDFSTRLAVDRIGHVFVLVLHIRAEAENSSLLEYDPAGNILQEIPLYALREPGAGAEKSIMCSFGFISDRLYFHEGPYQWGYQLTAENVWDTTWHIDGGKDALPPEAYWEYDLMSFFEGPGVAAVFESESYLIIGGVHKRSSSKLFVYNKHSHQLWPSHVAAETENLRDMVGIFNDYDGGLPFYPQRRAGTDCFLQINDAQRYIDLINGKLTYHRIKTNPEISPTLREFSESLNPEDNPVVMVVQFKVMQGDAR
jgi:hypothetical protein